MATDGKTPTRDELIAGARAVVEVGRAIYETILEVGPLGAPESIIYMALAERGLSERVAATVIDALIRAGLVERRNHALVALPR